MATRRCGWCLNPYEHQPRASTEIELFRTTLFVCDSGFEPSVCDGCFSMVMETAPPRHLVDRVPTLLLRVA